MKFSHSLSCFYLTLSLNPLYTAGLFHCYMLDDSICHFRAVSSKLLLLFYFLWKTLIANNEDPGPMPHYVVSDLVLHCLPMTILRAAQ